MALVFIILQATDGILTTLILGNGFGYEFNPVVSPIAGYWWFALAKVGVVAVVLFVLHKRLQGQEKSYRLANKGLMVLVVGFCLIVGWNIFVLAIGVL